MSLAAPSPSQGGVSPNTSSMAGPSAALTSPGGAKDAAANNKDIDGMRREWNFSITLSHQAAKAVLHLVPQWRSGFTPPEVLAKIAKEAGTSLAAVEVGAAYPHHHVGGASSSPAPSVSPPRGGGGEGTAAARKPSPLVPWYTYTDSTSSTSGGGAGGAGGAAGGASPSGPAGGGPMMGPDAASWEEVKKEICLFYCNLPTPMTLEAFCQYSVQQVLSYNPTIVSIDGDANLRRLKMARKVTGCAERLGGQPSFTFKFETHGTASRKAEHGVVIGTCVDHRGYVIVLRSEKEAELDNYFRSVFIRHFRDGAKFSMNQSVSYTAECTNSSMRDAQRLFGELKYFDNDAALSFALAMHPMNIRPDFSPTQTVGVGSIACMTFEVDAYQRVEVDLLEENDDGPAMGIAGGAGAAYRGRAGRGGAAGDLGSNSPAELPPVAGSELITMDMSKYKGANAVLFVDVELVSKQGYPTSMSINQYLNLKLRRLLDTFKDAKLIGEPQQGQIGQRLSRSQHVTFMYEGNPSQAGIVKALLTCTLVGNHGITAMYFTRLAQGLFDHHLYLFQHLVRSFQFYGEGDLRGPFSRFDTRHKARLTEVELAKAYPQSVAVNEVKEAHLKALLASNDGRHEGAVVYVVDPHSLVCVRKESIAPAGVSPADGASAVDADGTLSRGSISMGESPSSPVTAIAGRGRAMSEENNNAAMLMSEEAFDDPTEISVASVPHLAGPGPHNSIDYSSGASGATAAAAGGGVAGAGADLSPESHAIEGTIPSTSPNDDLGVTAAEAASSPSSHPHHGNSDDRPQTALDTLEATTVDYNNGTLNGAGSPQLGNARGATPNPTSAEASPQAEGSPIAEAAEDSDKVPPPPKSSAIVEEVLAAEDNLYFGPSLRDVYCRCCEQVSCRPNSYLFNKLPRSSRFTEVIEELDLSSNYLGHQGFQAILNFLEYLPKIQTLIFNDMSLDNEDIRHLCECMEKNATVRSIQLKGNPKVSLPATRHITRMIRVNPRIHTVLLTGTSLGDGLIRRIEADAAANKKE